MQGDPRSRHSKMQRTDANVDRARTLVRSDRRLGVRVIADELNMNRETLWHCKGRFGDEKYFLRNGTSNLIT